MNKRGGELAGLVNYPNRAMAAYHGERRWSGFEFPSRPKRAPAQQQTKRLLQTKFQHFESCVTTHDRTS